MIQHKRLFDSYEPHFDVKIWQILSIIAGEAFKLRKSYCNSNDVFVIILLQKR